VKRAALAALATLAVLALLLVLAWHLSPWPRTLLIRSAFEAEANRTAQAMWRHAPAGVQAQRDLAYDPSDADARLDLYRPATAEPGEALPVVVWFHGGAFISGRRADVAPYLHILAAEGYATVAVGYSLAPRARYPTPLLQANTALGWLHDHAAELGLDMDRIVLAGDSAGAQLAAQMALLATDPAYAQRVGVVPRIRADQLRATVLACGALDLSLVDLDGDGAGSAFMRTVTWAYSGRRDFRRVPGFDLMSVAEHVGPGFPPTFITAGNADPLLPHSLSMQARLLDAGVEVDGLFFPPDHTPALPHEYQFNLDSDEGRLALERIQAFLGRRIAPAGRGPDAAEPSDHSRDTGPR